MGHLCLSLPLTSLLSAWQCLLPFWMTVVCVLSTTDKAVTPNKKTKPTAFFLPPYKLFLNICGHDSSKSTSTQLLPHYQNTFPCGFILSGSSCHYWTPKHPLGNTRPKYWWLLLAWFTKVTSSKIRSSFWSKMITKPSWGLETNGVTSIKTGKLWVWWGQGKLRKRNWRNNVF